MEEIPTPKLAKSLIIGMYQVKKVLSAVSRMAILMNVSHIFSWSSTGPSFGWHQQITVFENKIFLTIGTISCFCICPTAALMCLPKSEEKGKCQITYISDDFQKSESETFASFAICSVFSSTSFSLFPLSQTASLAFAISDPPAAALAWKDFFGIFQLALRLIEFLALNNMTQPKCFLRRGFTGVNQTDQLWSTTREQILRWLRKAHQRIQFLIVCLL